MKKIWWFVLILLLVLALIFSYQKYQEYSKLKEQTLAGYNWVVCLSESPLVPNDTIIQVSPACHISEEYYLIMIGRDDKNINAMPEVLNCMRNYSQTRSGIELKSCLNTAIPIIKEKLGIS
jgi:hypothetical protein